MIKARGIRSFTSSLNVILPISMVFVQKYKILNVHIIVCTLVFIVLGIIPFSITMCLQFMVENGISCDVHGKILPFPFPQVSGKGELQRNSCQVIWKVDGHTKFMLEPHKDTNLIQLETSYHRVLHGK